MNPLQFQPSVAIDVLMDCAEVRIDEAKILFKANLYSGSVYLGGYAVECYLKAAICRRLEWNGLHPRLKTHNLVELLQFTGLRQRLEANTKLHESFRHVNGLWNLYTEDSVRYRRPTELDESTASKFLHSVADSEVGVAPWLRKAIS